MLKWLRGRNAVIESLPVEGKRKVILVRRDNIEHLVMVGGRNDLVIEPNIMGRSALTQCAGRRPKRWGCRPLVCPHESRLLSHPRRASTLNLFRDRAYPATTVKRYEEVALSTPGPGMR